MSFLFYCSLFALLCLWGFYLDVPRWYLSPLLLPLALLWVSLPVFAREFASDYSGFCVRYLARKIRVRLPFYWHPYPGERVGPLSLRNKLMLLLVALSSER